jgi:DNA-binding Xre family transcriptional regulator
MDIRLMGYRFLWVELQVVEICNACVDAGTADRIPYLLQRLPKNLQDIYHIVFQRVLASGYEKSELARKIFQWVMYARRPMTVEELEDAVSVSIDQKFWIEPSSKLRFSNLSRICGNLLSYDELDGVIYLAHHSIALFLQSCSDFYFRPSSAQSYLGKICVTYLMFGDFEKSLTTATDTRELRLVNHPVNPAAFALSGRNDRIFNSEIRLGDSLAHGGRSPECSMELDAEHRLRSILAATNRQQHTSFHLLNYCLTNWHQHCSHFTSDDIDGFSAFRQLVVRKDLPLPWLPWDHFGNSESYPHWGMFDWAVRHGNAAILQIWRECVPESIAANSWKRLCAQSGEKLFSAACAVADIAQLNTLITNCVESAAFHNSTNDFVFYALYYAAAFGYFKIVDRIIRTKPNFKIAPAKFRISRALVAAAAGGHRLAVELLIRNNANVNSAPTGKSDRTALQAAAEEGHVDLVELLIKEKADINAPPCDNCGRTALQAAAEGGYLAVVDRLIQEKADIDAKPAGRYGRTALQAAAEGGHLAVVKRLIQEMADVNAKPAKRNGTTALQAATNHEVLQILSAAGARY